MKMRKALLSLALAALLVAMLAAPTFAASGDLVYEMTQAEVDTYTAQSTAQSTDWLQNAGSATGITKEGSGIKYTGRPNDYSTLDIKVDKLAAGVEYTVIVKVKSLSGATGFKLGEASGPYGVLAETEADAESATLTYKYKDGGKNIRIQTTTLPQADIVIESIKIYEGEPKAGGSANPDTGDNGVIFLAVFALALAACATVVVARKVKVN